MRQVFSSQRVENVEAVAALLQAEGIEVKITNGRSWRGGRRGSFSYVSQRDPASLPAVWIVNADDQPRGRQLLRDMGLLESSRDPGTSYLTFTPRTAEKSAGPLSGKRLKLGLLVLIAAGIGLIAFTRHQQESVPTATPRPVATVARPKPLALDTITELQTYQAPVPTALAQLLIGTTLRAQSAAAACITVDGSAPSARLQQALATDKLRFHPASACPDGTPVIAINRYLTDGSGRGHVQLQVNGRQQTLEVERNGFDWQILDTR